VSERRWRAERAGTTHVHRRLGRVIANNAVDDDGNFSVFEGEVSVAGGKGDDTGW
jgi:hypothetical protein